MALNVIATGSTDVAAQADAIFIQVNAALTGTITCQAGGVTFATITNPTVGTFYQYGGLHGAGKVTVNPNATCDISVTVRSRM